MDSWIQSTNRMQSKSNARNMPKTVKEINIHERNTPDDQVLVPCQCSRDSGNPHGHPKTHNFLHLNNG